MDLDPIKQDIVTASHILHRQGIAAAFGHLSARIPGTDTFIFPPRMSPALVRLDNLLVLDVEGNQLSGDGRPNTEFWIHARIYKARPDVQSVCHVHPPSCVVLGSLGETIRPLHASGAIFKDTVQVFDPITLIRTRELGDQVAATLGRHSAMLLRGHGVNVRGSRRPVRLRHDTLDGRGRDLSAARDVGGRAALFYLRRIGTDVQTSLGRGSLQPSMGIFQQPRDE